MGAASVGLTEEMGGSPAELPIRHGGSQVAVVSLQDTLARSLSARYGVPAFNVLNDLTIEAVLEAAVQERSPVILQTSVKTVRQYGSEQLYDIFRTLVRGIDVPVTLHLDHCPYRDVISDCLRRGWNSVLFDAHELDVEENVRQTTEVVAEAQATGAHVEGEIEGIQGVEDGVGSDERPQSMSMEVATSFIQRTGVHCFAPAIGNAHGQYTSPPVLDHQRVTDLVEATGVPMALHGGTGLSTDQFQDLIARGCAKVNISTALKETFMKSGLAFLTETEKRGKWDPPSLFTAQKQAVVDMAAQHMQDFGSSGRAW